MENELIIMEHMKENYSLMSEKEMESFSILKLNSNLMEIGNLILKHMELFYLILKMIKIVIKVNSKVEFLMEKEE